MNEILRQRYEKFCESVRLDYRLKERIEDKRSYWGDDQGRLRFAYFQFHGLAERPLDGWNKFEGVEFLGIFRYDRFGRISICPVRMVGRVYIVIGHGVAPQALTWL